MKITKEQLKQIIKEELQSVLYESADREAVRGLLQYEPGVSAEKVTAMVNKLEQLGGEHWRLAAEEGELTDVAQQAIGLEIETPATRSGAPDPRAARMRAATSGWRPSLVARGGYDPAGKNWKDS